MLMALGVANKTIGNSQFFYFFKFILHEKTSWVIKNLKLASLLKIEYFIVKRCFLYEM